VTRRPTFRGLVRSRRAVIPASGYYEWRHAGDTRAEPYYIHPAEGLLYFAGLYSWWADPARPRDDPGRWHLTTTILTRAAVGDIRRLHDRAPVTLPDDLVAAWVDPRTAGDAAFVAAAVDAATPVT
ncbi:MAG TPA: SOS response-associated peptidase family protein, partial [Microbacteriaceae bacterium]|nr:SOS response-associated peptidase family protein [Microbacteriaceae bacterium]